MLSIYIIVVVVVVIIIIIVVVIIILHLMGAPTSEVSYTPAMPRREDHKVHKDMWWHGGVTLTGYPLNKQCENITLLRVQGKLFFVGVMSRKAEDKNYTVQKLEHSQQTAKHTLNSRYSLHICLHLQW